ncbi:hypothetical protein DKX38_015608 [Salix brachista]|uniref:Bet v I/Major latex protein domain-containing protein n=1 Tax=Salix brachista TaxID=2182728 RepID=A0A5N5L5N6_9ROSI|nr:hypothetical protein DKX38_015608 [Salix brachista]
MHWMSLTEGVISISVEVAVGETAADDELDASVTIEKTCKGSTTESSAHTWQGVEGTCVTVGDDVLGDGDLGESAGSPGSKKLEKLMSVIEAALEILEIRSNQLWGSSSTTWLDFLIQTAFQCLVFYSISKLGNLGTAVELKKLYNLWKSQAHHVPKHAPNNIQAVDARHGDWEADGFIKVWNYTVGTITANQQLQLNS